MVSLHCPFTTPSTCLSKWSLARNSLPPLRSKEENGDLHNSPSSNLTRNLVSEDILERGADVTRPANVYPPTVWGGYDFDRCTTNHNKAMDPKEVEVVKEKVKMDLLLTTDKPQECLELIDAIERLGVAYHFKDEIQEAITKMYHDNKNNDQEVGDLYQLSLKFRLFRQHGFYIATDEFKKFTDEGGEFLNSIAHDTLGILNLYEASYLRVHGEHILEKALAFTTYHMEAITTQTDHPFLDVVSRALDYPLQRIISRLNARRELASLEHPHMLHNEGLLKFARNDFNDVQSLYKTEIQQLTRWSSGIGFAKKFPWAKDRMVESYFWAVGALPEPEYSVGRIMFTKVLYITTALDDIYDSFGLSGELQLFSEAIERWDKRCMQQLPKSMKVFYETLLDAYDEMEKHVVAAGMPNYVTCVIQEVKALSREYNREFKWREEGRATTYEEYMGIALRNIGITVVFAYIFLGMGHGVAKEDFQCLSQYPKVVRSAIIIVRLISDIVQYEFDAKRGHPCAVEIYQKQHGISTEEACAQLYKQVDEAWIDINEEICLHPITPLPKHLITRILFSTQLANVLYHGDDGYGFVSQRVKDIIASLFIDPIPFSCSN